MLTRHSLSAVWRTKLKSFFFLFIIFALTVLLGMGVSLWNATRGLLKACETQYTTTAVLEYHGAEYPRTDIYDPEAAALYAEMDWAALGTPAFVRTAQPAAGSLGFLEGYKNPKKNMPQPDAAVLTVRIASADPESGLYGCWTRQILYAVDLQESATAYLYFDDGFAPVVGNTYLVAGQLVAGNGYPTLRVTPLVTQAGEKAGVMMEKAYLDITETGSQPDAPEQRIFWQTAAGFKTMNNGLCVRAAARPDLLEEFSQQEYTLTQGDFYAADETDGCLLPTAVAEQMGLSIGSRVKLALSSNGGCDVFESYWPDGKTPSETKEYTVTGLIKSSADSTPPVYVCDAGTAGGFFGYTLGTLELANDITAAQLEELRQSLPEGVSLTVYDQGYAVMHRALVQLYGNAQRLTAAAGGMTLAMLALFAYLFVGRQRESVETMYMLGTPRKGIRRYMLTGTAVILLGAAVPGSAVTLALAGVLNGWIVRAASSTQAAVWRYSSTNAGVTKTLAVSFRLPVWLPAACAGAIFVFGMLLCALFLRRVLAERRPKRGKARKRPRRATPREHRSLRMDGAARKYLLLSVARGGLRTAVVPAIALIMTLFMCTLGFSLQQYRARRAALDEETVIRGAFTDVRGKSSSGLIVDTTIVDALRESGRFTDFGCSVQEPYFWQGVARYADGTAGEVTPCAVPSGGFGVETYFGELAKQPAVFFTNRLSATAEFYGDETVEVTWLDGYDETVLGDETASRVCLAPAAFMQEHGLSRGDTVSLTLRVPVPAWAGGVGGYWLTQEEYTIVGTFAGCSTKAYLYAPLACAQRDFTIMTRRGLETLPVAHTTYDTVRFIVDGTERLQAAKDWLYDAGFSMVRYPRGVRQYVLLEDKTYLADAQNLDGHIQWLERVLPVAAAVMLALGAAVSYLMTSRRRTELATLRGLGTSKAKLFGIFFGEQALLCLAGCLAGAALWLALRPGGVAALQQAGVFAAGYLLGTAVSTAVLAGGELLGALSEKE